MIGLFLTVVIGAHSNTILSLKSVLFEDSSKLEPKRVNRDRQTSPSLAYRDKIPAFGRFPEVRRCIQCETLGVTMRGRGRENHTKSTLNDTIQK